MAVDLEKVYSNTDSSADLRVYRRLSGNSSRKNLNLCNRRLRLVAPPVITSSKGKIGLHRATLFHFLFGARSCSNFTT
ncbi:uncharacterized protein PHALS_13991 [Plasmopara halstedii]|uniref:Uncharacterized protein n=1 Tax=Plasmopara halstedii TaxID=4781 RepID=A0A0P1ARX8_PLAHL|nr:uncharacterized protein PHALS_13991 [Plasmopara halstedii]CEG43697.1 hypothetical protein PHALS_13991 [Plasmopara halstedii]|eukprot:XP_024580066.1 hypothetical protein PHALS_13991 [Plasmopara halstedii]